MNHLNHFLNRLKKNWKILILINCKVKKHVSSVERLIKKISLKKTFSIKKKQLKFDLKNKTTICKFSSELDGRKRESNQAMELIN